MSGITFVDTVTHVPAPWANAVNRLVYDVFQTASTVAEAQAALQMGSLAFQMHGNVNIEGGNINGVDIGTVTPVPHLVANSARVLDDPIDDHDVVNKGWLRTWVANSLTVTRDDIVASLGSMAFQNKNSVAITGGAINSTDIGLAAPASGKFTTLKASSPAVDADDVVTLGFMTATYDVTLGALRSMAYQAANAVAITGGTIDGTRIGQTVPAIGRFSHGSVVAPPATAEDITNKRYVDSSITAFANGLRSMAYQDANNVAITGGAINGVSIGALTPVTLVASAATIIANTAWLTARTTSSGANNIAGMRVFDGTTQVASLAYYGANNANPNRVVMESALPMYLQSSSGGAGAVVSGPNITLFGGLLRAVAEATERMVLGTGSAKTGYQLTSLVASWFDKLDAKRSFSQEGHSDGYDTTYATVAAGNILLPVNTRSAMFVNLTGNATVLLPTAVSDWTGLRVVRIIVRHDTNGKLVAWPVNVFWTKGTAPDYADALANDFDMIEMWTFNGGASWFAKSAFASGADAGPIIDYFTAT